jgi:ribose/xylose/arabinose/galactoside ABC-type transport system permease subunit
MALGVTFVVIGGNLDLSVGSMMSFSTIVVLDLHDKASAPRSPSRRCSR